MRTSLRQALLTFVTLACTTSIAAAQDLGYTGLERRLSPLPQRQSAMPGVQQVAYLSEIEATEEQLPRGAAPMPGYAPMPEEVYEPVVGYGDDCYCSDHCCQPHPGYCQANTCHCQPSTGMLYTEAQLMFLRAHVLEESLGKLSEKYEFTPRFILGYEAASGLGARARYWTYGRTTPNLDDVDEALRLEFDVIDVEGTSRFRTERADLVLAAGFRWLSAETELDDESVSSDGPGLTVAVDVRTLLCRRCRSEWSGVAGARWSILGADWEGDDDGFIEPTRDDNIVVQELYGGFEYLCCYRKCNLYARAVFEVQNWRSDALGESADTDSIGFVGPGIHVGATY